MEKTEKVYKVTTARLDKVGGDTPNYASYNVVATDAQRAINRANKMLDDENSSPDEYVESVTKLADLDIS